MSSIIRASEIKNIHIYSNRSASQKLDLCTKHKSALTNGVSQEINSLIATKVFQSQIKDFFPAPDSDEEVHVKILITDREITVQKMDEETHRVIEHKKIHLDAIQDEAGRINCSILKKANKIYHEHLRETPHRHRNRSPSFEQTESSSSEMASDSSDESHFETRGRRRRKYRDFEPESSRIQSLSSSSSSERTRSFDQFEAKRASARTNPAHPRQSKAESRRHRNELDHQSNTVERHTQNRPSSSSPRTRHLHSNKNEDLTMEAEVKIRRQLEDLKAKGDHPATVENLNSLERPSETIEQNFARPIQTESPSPNLEQTLFVSMEDFKKLTQVSQKLSSADMSGSKHLPWEFKEMHKALPEPIRNNLYYHTYLLIDPQETNKPWPIGQKLFEGNSSSESATNKQRAFAILNLQLHSLSKGFADIQGKTPPADLLEKFSQLPEEDKNAVYTQLAYIQPKGDDYQGPKHAFEGSDRLSVTNQERSVAIQRAVFERIADYHRNRHREEIKAMNSVLQDVLSINEAKIRELEKRLERLQKYIMPPIPLDTSAKINKADDLTGLINQI